MKTASQNYNLSGNSVNLTHGPTPTATTGNVFFYNQYDNTTHLYLFYMFGVKGNSVADTIKIDIITDNNSSTDAVIVEDDYWTLFLNCPNFLVNFLLRGSTCLVLVSEKFGFKVFL